MLRTCEGCNLLMEVVDKSHNLCVNCGGEEIKEYPEYKYWYKNRKRWNGSEYKNYHSFIRRVGLRPASNYSYLVEGRWEKQKSSKIMVEYEGERLPLSFVCKDLGISYEQARQRLSKLGWSLKKVIENAGEQTRDDIPESPDSVEPSPVHDVRPKYIRV